MNLDKSTELLNGLVKFLENYRDVGFEKTKSEAKELAKYLQVSVDFKTPRYQKNKIV